MRQIVSLSLPQDLHRQVQQTVATKKYASVSEFMRELLRQWFSNQEHYTYLPSPRQK